MTVDQAVLEATDMILYLEDFALFPEQTFRVDASINGEGLAIKSIEWILPHARLDITKMLTDNEYAKIVAQAWELAKEEV